MKFPKILNWHGRWVWVYAVGLICLLVLMQASARLVMQLAFFQDSLSFSQGLTAHIFGTRFDLRLACIAASVPLLISAIPWIGKKLHPVSGTILGSTGRLPQVWPVLAAVLVGIWSLIVYADFGNMAYWTQRLNVGVLFLLNDFDTNSRVLWDSYPVATLAASTVALSWLTAFLMRRWAARLARTTLHSNQTAASTAKSRTKTKSVLINLFLVAVIIFCIHGRWSQYPLRWSDLVRVGHAPAEQLAINPVQNIVDTMAYRKPQFNAKAVTAAYPQIAPWLGAAPTASQALNFARTPQPRAEPIIPKNANVVLVILESLSGYKTSLHDNQLNPTPYLKSLADQGWWFNRFGSAHPFTARGVYAIITSRPDVSAGDTASRNPQAILHRSLISAWTEHQPYYFIGGSTSWANVRGLITKAVPGVQIFEEENLKTPRTDVWGLSDRNLFYESIGKLNQHVTEKKTPFFAVIQTAANHRPYTIPSDDPEFKVLPASDQEVSKHGLLGGAAEFNAIRLMDHSVAKFMEKARQTTWFDNTVFVFLGDHGTSGPVPPYMPAWMQAPDMAVIHTPLIFYAPKFIQPKRIDTLGQQADVLPTLLDMTGRSAELRGFGRSLLAERPGVAGLLTSFQVGGSQYGWFDGRYYAKISESRGPSKVQLFDLSEVAKHQIDIASQEPERTRQLAQHLEAYYQTARYLIVNP
jgi:Sulfatase